MFKIRLKWNKLRIHYSRVRIRAHFYRHRELKMASLFHLPSSLTFSKICHSAIRASHSHSRVSVKNENPLPKLSKFSSKTLNFLLSGSLALALSLTGNLTIKFSISMNCLFVVCIVVANGLLLKFTISTLLALICIRKIVTTVNWMRGICFFFFSVPM